MSHSAQNFARRAIWALPVWAAMLFLGTFTHQPDPQTDFAGFAAYVTTPWFLFSHLFNSIFGAFVGSLGITALGFYLQDTPAARKALTGMVATVAANILNTALFGTAAFFQPAIGRAFLAGQENALDLYNGVYAAPLFATAILGVLMLLIGGISTGAAIATSGRFPRWAGWVYGAAMAAFALSVFFFSSLQSVLTALIFVSAAVVAWQARRDVRPHSAVAPVGP